MLGQSIGSDESKRTLNGRFRARHVRKTELWHEECQFSGSYFMRVTSMNSILLDVCAKCSTNAEERERAREGLIEFQHC